MNNMRKQITIKDYDLDSGRVETHETSPFLGINIGSKHYILSEDDYVNAPVVRGVTRPKTAYELVRYNQRTGVAKAREITDPSLLEKIAIEFHFQWRE